MTNEYAIDFGAGMVAAQRMVDLFTAGIVFVVVSFVVFIALILIDMMRSS